jgi:hypothetical protein
VPEKLLDALWMLASHEEYCSASVPEVVKRDGGQFRPPTKRLEVTTREVRRPHGGADSLAELGSREALQESSPVGNGVAFGRYSTSF